MSQSYYRVDSEKLVSSTAEEATHVLLDKEGYEEEARLLASLLRISRERANAARGMRPKKRNHGYKILASRPWTERYTVGVIEDGYERTPLDWVREQGHFIVEQREDEHCWVSTIQTPYGAGLDVDDVNMLLIRDLNEFHILDDLGIDLMKDENGAYPAGTDYRGCILYRWKLKFRAGAKTAYWEADLFTTDFINIPSELSLGGNLQEEGESNEYSR